MSKYKLTYFNIPGLAEPTRFLLSYGAVDFEDYRITRADWPALKPSTPLEQLPILEVDGKMLYQSNAIARFLAKKFGLFGSNDSETFDIDATMDTIADVRQLFAKWGHYASPEERIATKEATFTKLALYFTKLEALAKKNGGYFVGGKLSAAEIIFAGFHSTFLRLGGEDILADYPTLRSIVAKVYAEPRIKSYIANRPEADR